MMSRATRIKLVVFAVIATVTVVYVGGRYAGLDRLFGSRGYVVTAQLADSGGIFTGAEVTYRGVTVGTVRSLNLTDSGVDVALDIDDEAPGIPSDTEAVVANRSAVGEQYVDLRPSRDGGPFLVAGSVLRQDRTKLPVAPETVLANLDKLVSSVDTRSLRTIVDEAYRAFSDAGPDMQKLLDTARSFTTTARQNLPETQRLLTTALTVLRTQNRHADDLTTFASGLNRISKQFEKSDPDLRKIIDRAPPVGEQVSDFLDTSGNDLGVLFANLLTTANITSTRTENLEQLLINFSVISAFAYTASEGGRGQLGLVFDMFNPPSCTRGYETTKQRPADDESEVWPNVSAYCAEPRGSRVGVRGAQNVPFAGSPAMVTPSGEQRTTARDSTSLPGVLDLPTTQRASGGIGGLLGTN